MRGLRAWRCRPRATRPSAIAAMISAAETSTSSRGLSATTRSPSRAAARSTTAASGAGTSASRVAATRPARSRTRASRSGAAAADTSRDTTAVSDCPWAVWEVVSKAVSAPPAVTVPCGPSTATEPRSAVPSAPFRGSRSCPRSRCGCCDFMHLSFVGQLGSGTHVNTP
ncbi:hypothetical protein ASG36_03520 [Geodermatophilus sp. Leaf369]|nr:hypothetical protein ASG36_03520 [Geodermatophilus sp. Leaf369]